MFLDTAVIFCRAGKGGDGKVNFHREKFVPAGGPDGGDGGKGGDIYFQADGSLTTLIDFRYSQHFRAESGERGGINFSTGASGKDIVIRVPRGTVINDFESGGIIADVYGDGEKVLVLKGGKGGRGNARFCTPTRRAPAFAENGDDTTERKFLLELKTIADVGLVGFPNVGKSTVLSVISAAKPKIANYHFTTLSPNLGVVKHYEQSFVAADIPGLIEGASEGVGLGHDFLRHIERVRLIVHVVDISGCEGREPKSDYEIIRAELKNYSGILYGLPEIIVANKCDMIEGEEAVKAFEKAVGKKVFPISAITNKGLKPMLDEICAVLKTLPPPAPLTFEKFEYERQDKSEFDIDFQGGVFVVSGAFVEELARKTYFDDPDSFNWFQRKMRDRGIIDALKEKGAEDGDTVRVLDVEFELLD